MQNYTISPEQNAILLEIFAIAGFTTARISLNGFDFDCDTVQLYINDRRYECAIGVQVPACLLWETVDESGYNGYIKDRYNQDGIDCSIDEVTPADVYFNDHASSREKEYFCTAPKKKCLWDSVVQLKHRRVAA